MITTNQLAALTKKYKINGTVIAKEYLQILFLSKLYSLKTSENIFFKGGTALHLLFGAKRFSEDLDFTVNENEGTFNKFISKVFDIFIDETEAEFKQRKTIAGKRFLLKAYPSVLPYEIFINLDFSFREKVINPQKSTYTTDFPVLFTSFIYHLSKEEIFAEKIRAFLTRNKGRDLYDLWYLTTQNIKSEGKLIREKLKYYGLENINKKVIMDRVNKFSRKNFIADIRPFIPINERKRLPEFFTYLKEFLENHLTDNLFLK